MPSSDEEVVEEPQNRRTRMSLGTKGLKVNLFPGLSPSALKVPSDHSANIQLPSQLATCVQPFFSPSPLHSPIPFFQFLLSFSPVRALLYPVLWAKWGGSRNKVCSVSQTSWGRGGHKPCPSLALVNGEV